MPELGVYAVAVVAVVTVLRAPLQGAVVVLLAVTFLVPNNLHVPGFPDWLSLVRVVLWAFAVGLLVRIRKGDVASDVLSPTRVHAAFGVFLILAFLIGVGITLPPSELRQAISSWLVLLDQLVIFACVLAAARATDPWRLARPIVALVTAVALIALAERWWGWNYGRWWFQELPGAFGNVAAGPLSYRGGAVRVRGPAQFALELAWVLAVLVPLAVVVATRSRRLVSVVAPVAMTLAMVWTISRSAVFGTVLGILLLVAGSRFDRRVATVVALGVVAALVVGLGTPSLRDPYDEASPDSAASRVRRLVVVTDEVENRPLTGLGLYGLRARGIQGTDTSYVLLYAGLGVIGIAAFGLLLVTTVASAARGLRGPPDEDRVLAAACFSGLVVGLAGAAWFDEFTVPGSAKVFWILAALAVNVAEQTPVRAPTPRPPGPSLWRGLVPVAAVGAGVAMASLWPTHVAGTWRFETLPVAPAVPAEREPLFAGRMMLNTACGLFDAAEARFPGAAIECRDQRDAPGIGLLRVQGDTAETVVAAARGSASVVRGSLANVRLRLLDAPEPGRPTFARTAPVWLGMTGLAAALLVPALPHRGRRRRLRHPRIDTVLAQ